MMPVSPVIYAIRAAGAGAVGIERHEFEVRAARLWDAARAYEEAAAVAEVHRAEVWAAWLRGGASSIRRAFVRLLSAPSGQPDALVRDVRARLGVSGDEPWARAVGEDLTRRLAGEAGTIPELR